MIKLAVPLPPSTNHAYFYKGGKRIKTTKTKAYEERVRNIVNAMNFKMLPHKEKIIMELYFYFPDHRIRDTHNMEKILLDCLQKILYENDYWVLPRIMDFEIVPENARVDLALYLKEGA